MNSWICRPIFIYVCYFYYFSVDICPQASSAHVQSRMKPADPNESVLFSEIGGYLVKFRRRITENLESVTLFPDDFRGIIL